MTSPTKQVFNVLEQVMSVLIPVGAIVEKYVDLPEEVDLALKTTVALTHELKRVHAEMENAAIHRRVPSNKDWSDQNDRFAEAAAALQGQIMFMVPAEEEPEPEPEPDLKPVTQTIEHKDLLGLTES